MCYTWGSHYHLFLVLLFFFKKKLAEFVGHRVKIHKITPAQGKERGDVEIRDYVVLQKPAGCDRLPSSSTYIDIRFYNDAYA